MGKQRQGSQGVEHCEDSHGSSRDGQGLVKSESPGWVETCWSEGECMGIYTGGPPQAGPVINSLSKRSRRCVKQEITDRRRGGGRGGGH